MVIDHVGYVNEIVLFRLIGRVAFPIYAFSLVEGYMHTSNIKMYIFRLLYCAVISEPIFDLFFFRRLTMESQNTVFTLSLGLLTIYSIDRCKYKKSLLIVGVALGVLLRVDYSYSGVLIICVFFIWR